MVPMIIVVRVGLGLAYQGASTNSPMSFSGRRNNGQLSTFQAAAPQTASQHSDAGSNIISLVTSSSGTKSDSRVAGDHSYANKGTLETEKEGKMT